MKKLLISILAYGLMTINLFSQVNSVIYTDSYNVFDIKPDFLPIKEHALEIELPGINIEQLLLEDEKREVMKTPFRFGKGFDVSYSLSDGIWLNDGKQDVWLMNLTSPEAYSINLIFNKLFIPDGSELYLYNSEGSMLYGPITSKQNLTRELFLTDVIKGSSIYLQLSVPAGEAENVELSISRVVLGYKDIYANLFKSTVLNESGSCQKDLACYSSWETESDAVALILLSNGEEVCTGSLMNNTNEDYKAYILTAFHCVDASGNGSISATEESNAENWMFKFNYKKTSCNGSQIASTTTYNHDDFKAGWSDSDFALLELDDSPLYDMCVSFLGWSRSQTAPSEGTSIHHPSGDVMKISFDDDQLVETDLGYNSGDGFWKVNWDIGATERYSSGAPLFDQNKRVIGQLAGGESECGGSDMRDWYGCFHESWSGGGTSTTRLSNWLGSTSSPTTLNTTRYVPHVTGPDMICNTNSTFTLHNVPSGATVTWTASYATPSSGTGTTATIKSNCSIAAVGAVTFSISNCCGFTETTQSSKTYTSAGPNPASVELDVYTSGGQQANKSGGTWLLCPNSTYHIYLDNNTSCSTSQYSWTLPSSLTKNYAYNNMVSVTTNSSPGGNILVYAQTCCSGCGSNIRILSDYVGTDYSCGYPYFRFVPDPSVGETTLELETSSIPNYSEGDAWNIEIFDQQLQLKYKKEQLSEKTHPINTSGWKAGIYIVRLMMNGRVLSGKLMVAE